MVSGGLKPAQRPQGGRELGVGGAPASIEWARAQRRHQADATHAAALRRARAERAAPSETVPHRFAETAVSDRAIAAAWVSPRSM
jgi:hypothetical protein